MAKTFVWTGAQDTNFDNAENWNDVTDGLNPATNVPGAQDTAEFITGGGTISGTGNVAALLFSGADPWALSGGALLTVTVGFTDTGTLTIQNGATITSPNLNSAFAPTAVIDSFSAGSTAVLRVDGAGSDFFMTASFAAADIGTTGIGSLIATNGGTVILAGHVFIGAAPDQSSIQVDGRSSVEIGTAAAKAAAGAVTVDAFTAMRGIHTLEGSGTIVGNLVDNYVVIAQPRASDAPIEITGAVTGNGLSPIGIQDGAILQLDSSFASSESVQFMHQPNSVAVPTLRLLDPSAFTGALYDFASPGDTLELVGQKVTGASRSGSTMTVSLSEGGPLRFNLAGAVSASLISAGSDVLVASATTPCFRAGTLIATPVGDVAVEKLRTGDAVVAARGGNERVVWIGRRLVDCRHHPDPKQIWPVCVTAGAFGPNQPRRDLWLSPDHAVYREGVLIPIKYLINGSSIAQVSLNEVTYYHVELRRHDVLLAEGLPVESYLDTGDRSNFTNDDAVVRFFPDFSGPSPDATTVWEALGCARLVVCGPELEAVRALLTVQMLTAAQAIATIHPQPVPRRR